MKLFCFPHAGGYSYYYNFIKQSEYKNIDQVFIYEYYGRNAKKDTIKPASFNQLVQLASEYVYSNLNDGEELALFGHSMGALLAYEVSVYMVSAYNISPSQVFLSGQRPPCTVEYGYYSSDPDIAISFLKNLGGMKEIWNANEAIRNFFLPILLGDLAILETYTPTLLPNENRLKNCVLLYGDNDYELRNRDMDLWNNHFENIDGKYVFKGEHFYINDYHEKITNIINKSTWRC